MSDQNDWGQPDPQFQNQDQYQPPSQAPQAPLQKTKVKHQLEGNDLVAIILSFFIPGLGHILAGQTMKGAAILAAVVLTCGVGYMLTLLVVADAYFVVMCKKDRPVGDWEFFPDYNRYI